MILDNLRLRSKALIPLALLALTMCAMLAMAALQSQAIVASTQDIVSHRDLAALKLGQAANVVEKIPYAVAMAILSDSRSPASLKAQKDFDSAPIVTENLLQAAQDASPRHAEEIARFKDRVKALVARAKPIYRVGLATPGLDEGLAIRPDDLEKMANATKSTQAFDDEARALIDDIVNFDSRLMFESAGAVEDQREQSRSSLSALGLVGSMSALAALAFSFWLSVTRIQRPLDRLRGQMQSVAEGDLTQEIDGGGRRDEIGEMARAVEVLKANAVARRHAEAEAERSRAAVEAERGLSSEHRARAREAQTAAMNALRDGLRRLADGNLTTRLNDGFIAEFFDVRDDFNAAADKLRGALGLVARSTGSLQTSSQEITSAADNLSRCTAQQAEGLEETAAALAEITETLRGSANNAQHAAGVVANADCDAKKGAVVARQAVEAMDVIAASSHKIGQIIGVIDEIAFQTNLLALNAGVEAARAGDSGRGFAVVAMEVRALAQRSAGAAKEIKALVSASGAQVHSGVKLVAETGKALETIIAQVSEINEVVGEIAQATQQQATGVAEINAAISQMDHTTQQNASMVAESTVASHALSRETAELTRLVEQFRLGEPGEDDLRRHLKSAAPHVFAPRAAPPSRARSGSTPRLARNSGAGDWRQF